MIAPGRLGGTGFGGTVLAGGRSRRMGTDKSLITIDGVALVERAVSALTAAGADPVVVVGGDRAALERLGLTVVDDRWPGEGPLGGIITALSALDTELVAVLSCDLTDASASAVARVVGALGTADVAVPVVDGRTQWMHAVWRRSALPALRARFEAGVRAPRDAVDSLEVAEVLGGDPAWFHDADRPEDLASIARMDMPEIDVNDLARKLDEGAPVFDVREDDEWEEAHIDGATLVPLGTVTDSVERFPSGRPVYVICAKGGRSARAVEFLRSQGVDAVNVAGGMGAWIEAGQPVSAGDS
ncbi:MAG: NTP transferase domain-containing protein [Acidimicrobiales bacterium]